MSFKPYRIRSSFNNCLQLLLKNHAFINFALVLASLTYFVTPFFVLAIERLSHGIFSNMLAAVSYLAGKRNMICGAKCVNLESFFVVKIF